MPEIDDTLKNSRVWHDRDGACWLMLHVPDNADVGEMGSVLWREYCKYLEDAYENTSGSNVIGSGGQAGRNDHAVPAVSR